MPWHRYRRTDPRRQLVHARVILGRRGTALLLLGVLWILNGFAVLLAPDSTDVVLLSGVGPVRAAGWIATGLVAVYCARLPAGRDQWGWLSLYVMAAWRVIAYAVAWVAWLIPSGDPGNPRGLIGVGAWLVVVTLIVIMAGWPEPPEGDGGTS